MHDKHTPHTCSNVPKHGSEPSVVGVSEDESSSSPTAALQLSNRKAAYCRWRVPMVGQSALPLLSLIAGFTSHTRTLFEWSVAIVVYCHFAHRREWANIHTLPNWFENNSLFLFACLRAWCKESHSNSTMTIFSLGKKKGSVEGRWCTQ